MLCLYRNITFCLKLMSSLKVMVVTTQYVTGPSHSISLQVNVLHVNLFCNVVALQLGHCNEITSFKVLCHVG